MTTETTPEARARKRKKLLFFILPVLVVAIYLGWVFYSRGRENRQIDAQARARQNAKQTAEDRKTVELMGGNRFEITNFYANPTAIRRGESAEVCYGMSNAKSVTLDPPDAPVWPAFSRCFDVTPKKETTYTLTATDAAGNTKTSTLTIKVK
ncbi:MAG: hypothetical protein GZ088_12195 [Acidipila sp.]|nr:hypothetical protein [Acidipila sp.]